MMMRFTITLLASLVASTAAFAAGDAEHPHAPHQGWTFDGVFGSYDPQTLQRGYLVFEQVCASCHSLDYVAFRNLAEPGGPGFTMDQVRIIAAEHQVPVAYDADGNTTDENGLPLTEAAEPDDRFPAPYPNEPAARAANGGALPPDLSLMAKARHNGPSYIYSLMLGFEEAPEGEEAPRPGLHYNPYFAGHWIAMAPQLRDGGVEFPDGTEPTAENQAYAVANFLMWAAEPHLEKRKRMGFQVLLFMFVLAVLLYFAYRQIWADQH